MNYRHPARARVSRDDGLAPTMLEIVAMAGVLIFYLLAVEFLGPGSYLLVNVSGPLMMLAILGFGAWRMLRADGRNVWTPLFWFRLSTGVYFGLGTYVVFIANNVTRLYAESFYRFFDEDIFKMNLVVALSVVLVLSTAKLALAAVEARMGRRTGKRPIAEDDRNLLVVGALFLVVGVAVNYGVKVPQDFGWTEGEWAESLLGLARLTMLGIFMLTLWSLKRARWFLPIITAIAAAEMLFQLLLFAKGAILMTLVMYLLAFLWRQVTLARVALCAALAIGTYVGLQPIVSYCRAELTDRYGAHAQVGFGPRLDILASYTPDDPQAVATTEEIQEALLRVSYVNIATFVINQYDNGSPGDWPKLLPAVFVPRFLWPEKPIISDVGVNIYELRTGLRTSAVGAGLFADTYWAMGWWGVLLYMPIYGVILGVLTATTASILRQGRWLFFPIVLTGLQIGFRTDGHYITDVAGGTVILVGLYGILIVVDLAMKLSFPSAAARTASFHHIRRSAGLGAGKTLRAGTRTNSGARSAEEIGK